MHDSNSRYDAVIIGCSMAGLYAAELLAATGRKVGVFERRRSLDPSRRTLIVTQGLARVLGSVPEGSTLHRIQFVEVEAGAQQARIELDEPDLIVERSAPDRRLHAAPIAFEGFETDVLRVGRVGLRHGPSVAEAEAEVIALGRAHDRSRWEPARPARGRSLRSRTGCPPHW